MAKPKPDAGPYGEIRVRLPTFLILALREMVKERNARENDPRWSVSQLVETFLIESITREEMKALAKRSPELTREGRAWWRWMAEHRAERRGRK